MTWTYYKRWGDDPLKVVSLHRVADSGRLQTWTKAGKWVTVPGALPENDTMIDKITQAEAHRMGVLAR